MDFNNSIFNIQFNKIMIKKAYIQPEVKDVKILLPTILAGSEQVSTETITDVEDIASEEFEFTEEDEY